MTRFPCPVDGCKAAFDDVDALVGHVGGKAPYDDAHAAYGDVRRFELMGQRLNAEAGDQEVR